MKNLIRNQVKQLSWIDGNFHELITLSVATSQLHTQLWIKPKFVQSKNLIWNKPKKINIWDDVVPGWKNNFSWQANKIGILLGQYL